MLDTQALVWYLDNDTRLDKSDKKFPSYRRLGLLLREI